MCENREKDVAGLVVNKFLQVCKNLAFNGRRLFQSASTEVFFFTRKLRYSIVSSLRIQPPLIRSRYYVRNANSHVVAGANERRLYSQAT